MLNLEGVPPLVAAALNCLYDRTHFAECPPESFDPLGSGVDDAIRLRFGLPTLDSWTSGTQSYQFRRNFLARPASGAPIRFVKAIPPALAGSRLLTAHTAPTTPHSWPSQKSSNWSGAYVAPRSGRSIVSVMANWVVPAVTAPTGGVATEYRSSTWIGLDGQRSYKDSTLPQIGTSQFWVTATGAAIYGSWYQWWARGQHVPPVPLNLPVSPGDEISAIITVLDSSTVRFNIKNVSLGLILQAFDVDAPPGYTVSGGTAEWIMERPSPLEMDGWTPYELPAYQPFSFTGCIAEAKASADTTATPIDLELARLIRMYEIVQSPRSIRTISSAKKVLTSPQRLELTYLGN